MSLLKKLAELERTDPDGVKLLRQLYADASDPTKSAETRSACASALAHVSLVPRDLLARTSLTSSARLRG